MIDVKRMEEFAAGLDYHIKTMSESLKDLKEMKSMLDMILNQNYHGVNQEVVALKEEVNSLRILLESRGMPGINRYEKNLKKIKELINSDEWPEAVDLTKICETEEDKIERAKIVLDLTIHQNIEGTRFLDIGCGEGHMVKEAANRGAEIAVGYDVQPTWKFKGGKNIFFVPQEENIFQYAPYDIILIYDVIDEIQDIDPVECLSKIKYMLKDNGKIYIRTHPWSSRTGGCLYKDINKAFIHLILDDSELIRLFGCSSRKSIQLTDPQGTYRKWFKQAGLKILDESPKQQEVEDFFINPPLEIKEKLENHGIPNKNLSINYIDYVLEIDESNKQIF